LVLSVAEAVAVEEELVHTQLHVHARLGEADSTILQE
jgi:hypothetical protein